MTTPRIVSFLASGTEMASAVDGLLGFPEAALTDDAACEELIRASVNTFYHPVGTARMGQDAAAVVDPSLRVRGVTGLRVADASVMPTVIRGHTNAPAIVIGEVAAALIRRG